MKRIKIALATLLVLAMMAPMALADTTVQNTQSTSVIGHGTYANPATASVWSIEFPTAAKLGFTVDPKKMVKGSGMYSEEVQIEDGKTVLFPWYNEENALTNMKGESDEIKVRNMGTSAVTVELNVRPTDCSMKIASAAYAASPTDTDSSILLQAAVKPATGTATFNVIPAVGTNLTAQLATNYGNADETKDPFQARYNGGNGTMVMGYKEGVEVDTFAWESVSFLLKGETNPSPNADWSDASLTAPDLQFTWNVRTSAAEAIAIDLSSVTPSNYTWAADCLYAVPGQTVNVYVKPKDADADSPLGYWIDPDTAADQPGVIKTSVTNLAGTVVDDTTGDKYVSFSNGVVGDNGTIRYSFAVPAKDAGPAAFASKKADGTAANKIEITRGPTIKKVTSTATLAAITP